MKLTEKKRIVVKVGTSTLTHDTGKTNIARMAKLVSVPVSWACVSDRTIPAGCKPAQRWGSAN